MNEMKPPQGEPVWMRMYGGRKAHISVSAATCRNQLAKCGATLWSALPAQPKNKRCAECEKSA